MSLNLQLNWSAFCNLIFLFEGSQSEVDSKLGQSVPSFTTIKYWVTELKRCHTNFQGEYHNSRQIELATPKTVKKTRKMILDDSRLKLREPDEIIGKCL